MRTLALLAVTLLAVSAAHARTHGHASNQHHAAAEKPKTSWDLSTCTFTSGNKTWDFSPLFANNGSYTWQQTMPTWDPSNVYDGTPPASVPFTFELQVCGNVQTQHAACTTPSPINMIAADGTCNPLGSVDIAAFDVNPYGDGAYLTYYHGAQLNHIQKYEGRIYFVCDPTHFNVPVYAEHMKTFFQWHFKFFTKLAC